MAYIKDPSEYSTADCPIISRIFLNGALPRRDGLCFDTEYIRYAMRIVDHNVDASVMKAVALSRLFTLCAAASVGASFLTERKVITEMLSPGRACKSTALQIRQMIFDNYQSLPRETPTTVLWHGKSYSIAYSNARSIWVVKFKLLEVEESQIPPVIHQQLLWW